MRWQPRVRTKKSGKVFIDINLPEPLYVTDMSHMWDWIRSEYPDHIIHRQGFMSGQNPPVNAWMILKEDEDG